MLKCWENEATNRNKVAKTLHRSGCCAKNRRCVRSSPLQEDNVVVVENEKELTELLSLRKLANIKFPSIRRDQKYSLVMFSMP